MDNESPHEPLVDEAQTLGRAREVAGRLVGDISKLRDDLAHHPTRLSREQIEQGSRSMADVIASARRVISAIDGAGPSRSDVK